MSKSTISIVFVAALVSAVPAMAFTGEVAGIDPVAPATVVALQAQPTDFTAGQFGPQSLATPDSVVAIPEIVTSPVGLTSNQSAPFPSPIPAPSATLGAFALAGMLGLRRR